MLRNHCAEPWGAARLSWRAAHQLVPVASQQERGCSLPVLPPASLPARLCPALGPFGARAWPRAAAGLCSEAALQLQDPCCPSQCLGLSPTNFFSPLPSCLAISPGSHLPKAAPSRVPLAEEANSEWLELPVPKSLCWLLFKCTLQKRCWLGKANQGFDSSSLGQSLSNFMAIWSWCL